MWFWPAFAFLCENYHRHIAEEAKFTANYRPETAGIPHFCCKCARECKPLMNFYVCFFIYLFELWKMAAHWHVTDLRGADSPVLLFAVLQHRPYTGHSERSPHARQK